jgi:hypothetical protein
MTAPVCPFLRVEKIGHRRVGPDFEIALDFVMRESWWCRHPFHGIPLELGASSGEALEQCAACALPVRTPTA